MSMISRHTATRDILLVMAAGALVLGLAACEQKLTTNSAACGREVKSIAMAFDNDGRNAGAYGKKAEPASATSDLALLLKVKSALLDEPLLQAFPIDVGARRGVITLYGVVETQAHRDYAAKIAKNVEGVQAVKSGITVTRES